MKFCLLIATIIILSSCAEFKNSSHAGLPDSFTSENVMKIHQGMSSGEILKTFGAPKNVSQAICGTSTGHPWTCTTWEYGGAYKDRASFTFAGDNPESLILNNFKVDRN